MEVEQKQVVKKSRLDVNKTVDTVAYNTPGYWETKSPVYHNLTSSYPYRTRSATSGHIRLRDTTTSTKTFQHRAMVSYNRLPENIREGTLTTVKKNLKDWVLKNIPVD